jgi:hypothetical protein
MWVKKFKSPFVTGTKLSGQIVARTRHGWIERQGTLASGGEKVIRQ